MHETPTLTRYTTAPTGVALRRINPADPRTWTVRDDLPGRCVIQTSYNPVAFAPAWGLPGERHHFETLVTIGGAYRDSQTYRTEAEALDGHAVLTSRMRTVMERAS